MRLRCFIGQIEESPVIRAGEVAPLAAGRYKPVTVEVANHHKPKDILSDVLKLENEIIKRGNALLAQISGKR